MYYELFSKKVSELQSLTVKIDAIQQYHAHADSLPTWKEMQKQLVSDIIKLIKEAPIKKVLLTEFQKLKNMEQASILQALWQQDTTGAISFELWSELMNLEVAAHNNNLHEVQVLLENDELKAIAASNNNRVLRIAAMQNNHEVVEYLLFINSVCHVANQIPLIRSQADQTAQERFASFLRAASNFKQSSGTYLEYIKELIAEGNITDLDWKYLPHILSLGKVPTKTLKEVVSFMCVLPSVRMHAQQSTDFRELLFKTKKWLKGIMGRPVPDEVPRMGAYVVKLGVSAFNLHAYEKFLDEKAEKDKLREHFTEDELQKYYPKKFPAKAPSDVYHSMTIQNNKVTYNGLRKGKIK